MDNNIVIVGGGPTGLCFACSLANTDTHVTVIERQPWQSISVPTFDGRDIALTHFSVRILKQLGIWERLPIDSVSQIKDVKVMNGESPYSLNINSLHGNLGYLVSNHHIRKALIDHAQLIENLEFVADVGVGSITTEENQMSVFLDDGRELKASLVVAADSRFSETRRMVGISASMYDFGRVCIVCRMEHDEPHNSVAFECFNYGRTLAVLPLNNQQSSIVITAPMSDRDAIMALSDDQFNRDIQARFDDRLGKMRLVSRRFPYPLVAVHANKFFATRFALIGDAAVGMHPVTAHGFNLGLSGQEILAKLVIQASKLGADIGDSQLLRRYSTQHMRITRPIYHGTNEMVKMFTDDRLPTKILRRLTLRFANNFPPIKRVIRNKLVRTG